MNNKTVAVVDYGSGNLRSVSQAVTHAAKGSGFEVIVTSDAAAVLNAGRVVLPGQGHMADCMNELKASGLQEAVLHAAANKPLFGVCVGMQMLLDQSEEGQTDGLGLIPGRVLRFRLDKRLQADGSRFKVPHMGWNRVFYRIGERPTHPIWADIEDGSYFYFVHSYFADAVDVQHVAGQTDYGSLFACAIAQNNIIATQFHPEKSANQGLALYRNFLSWKP